MAWPHCGLSRCESVPYTRGMKRLFLPAIVASALILPSYAQDAKPIRVGMIGLDTSHCVAFTKILHDPANQYPVRVVAAVPASSRMDCQIGEKLYERWRRRSDW